MSLRFLVLVLSAAAFAVALLTGPPSFDSTDGAEFAVAGSQLQIAHAPGYPLFLIAVRLTSIVTSPLYGHLRLFNCLMGALLIPIAARAFSSKPRISPSSVYSAVLFVFASPVMAQLNSLEVYPLAMVLTLGAIALKHSSLAPYATGMALFGGHPGSFLCAPLMVSGDFWKKPVVITFIIPLTLYLYIPLRAGLSGVAHYGHPSGFHELAGYFTMYAGRLSIPSFSRLLQALSFIGPVTGVVFLVLALKAGRQSPRIDIPAILAILFLASYELPDPAGQLWILLIPLCIRCARGVDSFLAAGKPVSLVLLLLLLLSMFLGIRSSDRRTDDIAMRWTSDVMTRLPAGSVFRPAAHEVFYAAYSQRILGIRQDVILSDPFGNYFELMIPPPVSPFIGNRPVIVSRGWERKEDFKLRGLVFIPLAGILQEPDWENMNLFNFTGTSPDPMALDIVAEAWARRMIQTEDPIQRDSFSRLAEGFSATPITRSRIETLRGL